MFAFRAKKKLDRERANRDSILSRLQSEQRNYDSCAVQLAGFSSPRCGMERHGVFSKENKLCLEQELSRHGHAIARDTAALNESNKRCGELVTHLKTQVKGERVKFAFLASFF
ncbi:MAG TPA: hypothetical protein VF281_01265 [Candidatus Saccharimonadales bacterium]